MSILALLSFTLSTLFVYITIGLSRKLNLYDKPLRFRPQALHRKPIPRMGGIGFLLSTISIAYFKTDIFDEYTLFSIAFFLVILEGLLDDVFELNYKQKLVFETLASFLVILSGLGISTLGFGYELPEWFSVALTIFAFVGVINAFNMIDGADGVAGSISFISALTFAYFFFVEGMFNPFVLAYTLAFSILGFLMFNLPPARVFMGNVGSLALGFLFASFSVMLTQKENATIYPVIPVIVLSIPIFDTLWVIWRRLRDGHKVFHPDRRHLHHLLIRRLGSKGMLVVIVIMQAIFSLEAILLYRAEEYVAWLFMFINFLIVGNIYKLWKERKF